MSYHIKYQERALKEYELSVEWYCERSEEVALNFELSVKEKIDFIRISPTTCRKIHKQFYEIPLKKYPFSIIFLIDMKEKVVIISSIFHHKRNPASKFISRK